MSQRPIYLIVHNSPIFAAHWAMWIPSYDAQTENVGHFGKLIQVEGNPLEGFKHEFMRNSDITLNTSRKEVILIGWTNEANVRDGTNEGESYTDAQATDVIEEWALYTEAPGPSLRSAGSSSSGPGSRVQLQNCQTWMSKFVAILVENEILAEQANAIFAEAPKN
ncbi:hypothetical protein B7463_g10706, partial [Scytalidium lignicola]